MIAVQAADYFILHRDSCGKTLDVPNLVIWLAGLVLYRLLMSFAGAPGGYTSPVGYTAVDMVEQDIA